AVEPVWHLVYADHTGITQTARGSAETLRRSLRDGLLGDVRNAQAGRQEADPFRPLREYPEFRDLVIEPAPLPVPDSGPKDRVGAGPLSSAEAVSGPAITRRFPNPPAGAAEPADGDEEALDWTACLLLAALVIGGFLSGLWWLAG